MVPVVGAVVLPPPDQGLWELDMLSFRTQSARVAGSGVAPAGAAPVVAGSEAATANRQP